MVMPVTCGIKKQKKRNQNFFYSLITSIHSYIQKCSISIQNWKSLSSKISLPSTRENWNSGHICLRTLETACTTAFWRLLFCRRWDKIADYRLYMFPHKLDLKFADSVKKYCYLIIDAVLLFTRATCINSDQQLCQEKWILDRST